MRWTWPQTLVFECNCFFSLPVNMANHTESCLGLGRPGQHPEINGSAGLSLACCKEVEYTEQANSYLLWWLRGSALKVEIKSHKGLNWARSIQKENTLALSCSLSRFLLTPSTQPYMEPRSVGTSLLPIILEGLPFLIPFPSFFYCW